MLSIHRISTCYVVQSLRLQRWRVTQARYTVLHLCGFEVLDPAIVAFETLKCRPLHRCRQHIMSCMHSLYNSSEFTCGTPSASSRASSSSKTSSTCQHHLHFYASKALSPNMAKSMESLVAKYNKGEGNGTTKRIRRRMSDAPK